jgi:3D-(3,5/4)-trihydroxycyclohexane-1,2-dione acylhydrolase (decyclizing)
LKELEKALGGWKAPAAWTRRAFAGKAEWQAAAARVTGATNAALPSDAHVIGAVQRAMGSDVVALHAAGGLPGEMHKLWQAGAPGSLSCRIRLFLHGLRDRRRAGRQAGAAG